MTDWNARHGLNHAQRKLNEANKDTSNLEELVFALYGVIVMHVPDAAPAAAQLIKNYKAQKAKIVRVRYDE